MGLFGRYTEFDETRITILANKMSTLAADWENANRDGREYPKMPNWSSEAAEKLRSEIQDILDEAEDITRELRSISNAMFSYTRSHNTLREYIEDWLGGG